MDRLSAALIATPPRNATKVTAHCLGSPLRPLRPLRTKNSS